MEEKEKDTPRKAQIFIRNRLIHLRLLFTVSHAYKPTHTQMCLLLHRKSRLRDCSKGARSDTGLWGEP